MLGKKALGKYRLIRSIGSGANAEVYLAEPIRHPKSQVVVKRIHDHVAEHPKFNQLFEAEVRSMANFSHPYAVRLLDASLDDPIGPCLVMEYVPGITLEVLLNRCHKLSPQRVGRLLGFFGHTLQAAHDAGIIHRDLKPANLMISEPDTPRETLKVMDFGFAGFAAKPHLQLAELTGHGPIYAIGTPAFVSPEMIRGDAVDSRSDLYSVGVILFELLTGRLPFEYDEEQKLLGAHVKLPPPRFRLIGCGDIDAAIEGVVQLALSKYPNERQQSAREVVEGFGKAIGEDLWKGTAPAVEVRKTTVDTPTPPPNALKVLRPDPFQITQKFQAYMPEKLAAAKLRGFIEDLGGTILVSEPGLVRMQIGVPEGYKERPPGESSLFGWLATLRKPSVASGQEPIELELHMEKPNPSQAQLNVMVAFRPMKDYPPREADLWKNRCDKLYTMFRRYLGT